MDLARGVINEGRITRLEKVNNDLHEEMLQINARSMKDNVIFRNIDEKQNEDVGQVLVDFMKDEMSMKEEDEYSNE
jgi:hypothetical protein